MIIKFVIKFLLTCLPSGLTVAAPDAFGHIPCVWMKVVQLKLKFGEYLVPICCAVDNY